MANTWGQSGTTWGQNQWGDQADVDVTQLQHLHNYQQHLAQLYLLMK
jgi:hypothetical protein